MLRQPAHNCTRRMRRHVQVAAIEARVRTAARTLVPDAIVVLWGAEQHEHTLGQVTFCLWTRQQICCGSYRRGKPSSGAICDQLTVPPTSCSTNQETAISSSRYLMYVCLAANKVANWHIGLWMKCLIHRSRIPISGSWQVCWQARERHVSVQLDRGA